jgi:hypothetical protein
MKKDGKVGKYIACIVQEFSAEEAKRRGVAVPPDSDGRVRLREEYDVTAPFGFDPKEVGDSVAREQFLPGYIYCEWCICNFADACV